MTTLCGGGTSSAQPGFGASVSVGIAQLAALLNNVPTPIAFALAGYLGLVGYELSTFCASDPPAMPTLTGGDWAAALTLSDPVAHLAALQKFQNLFANLLWPSFCKCDSGPQPATPSLPTPPTDLPTVQPRGLPTAPVSSPCWDKTASVTVPGNGTETLLTDLWLPSSGGIAVTGGPVPGSIARPLPAGVTQLVSNTTMTLPTTHPFQGELDLWQFNASGATSGGAQELSCFACGGVPQPYKATIYATTAYWQLWTLNNAANSPTTISGEMSFFCGGTTPTVDQPCCPPDPSLQALLQAIQAQLNLIYEGLPSATNSYAESTIHSGLNGSGTLNLSPSCIAVRANITTDITGAPIVAGSPPYYLNRGFIVPIAAEGPIRSTTRLVYNPQLYVLPHLTEQLGYSFPAGLTVSITELTAGP